MSTPSTLRVGSRKSRLAQAQVKEIFFLLAEAGTTVLYEHQMFDTRGDRDQTTPLTVQPADDFFTDSLDQALLDKSIDIAVHSAKDLPRRLPAGLMILALTKAEDQTDAFVGKAPLAKLSSGARIGSSSRLRQEELRRMNPSLKICDIRGNIEDRLRQVKEGKLDGVIVATCALKRLGLAAQITDIMPWDATPLQGQLAVVGRSGELHWQKLFSAIDVRRTYGTVTLVGAGPGDPELITIKGVRALKKANCVFYDYLAHPELLDYALAAEKIYCGKRKGEHSLPQEELSRQLRDKAFAGKQVVRLKGGDPLIFARGADEMEYLQSFHIPVRIIPGISSATGTPSQLGIPLTARGRSSSVAFVSGHAENEKEEGLHPLVIPKADTIIFLMGLTKLDEIVSALQKNGWDPATPAAVISQGTRIGERLVTGPLERIAELARAAELSPPALIIVGKTVELLPPREDRPVILYTGTYPEKYKDLGRLIHHPMILIRPVVISPEKRKEFVAKVRAAQLILLTSRCAVKHFVELWISCGMSRRELTGISIAVIGAETSLQAERFGLNPHMTAEEETGEGLIFALEDTWDLSSKKVFFPRSSLPNPFIKDRLITAGAIVDEWTVYENIKPPKRPLPSEPIDQVIFTSPSTVDNFLADYGSIPQTWTIWAKGPRTAKHLKEKGYDVKALSSPETCNMMKWYFNL